MQTTYENIDQDLRLGKAPALSMPKMLHLSSFADTEKEPPVATKFWTKRAKFPLRHFGNRRYGDCTRASQALLAMRMERIETRSTPVITDEEVIRVYKEATARYFYVDWDKDPVGADTGMFEVWALDDWRRPELTFKDTKGRPLTIDAYTRINQANIKEVKNALWLSGAHGIKVCFNLPLAWQSNPSGIWDIPEDQQPVGPYLPGSWGGHSMAAVDYDEKYVYLPSSWAFPDGKITWRAFLIYCDEAYMVIDSIDAWKKKKAIDVMGIKKAVNLVSSYQIK
jgi:hypothetical protein